MPPINIFDPRFRLGVPALDHSHREMADLVNRMVESSNAGFVYLFQDLVSHTHTHFATEEVLMRQTGFPAGAEHQREHARVLSELDDFAQHLTTGRIALARAYVAEQLPAWFALHLATMDSALADYVSVSPKVRMVAGQRA
jgi:hemerythrin